MMNVFSIISNYKPDLVFPMISNYKHFEFEKGFNSKFVGMSRCRAKREHRQGLHGHSPESQSRIPAMTVLYVPNSLSDELKAPMKGLSILALRESQKRPWLYHRCHIHSTADSEELRSGSEAGSHSHRLVYHSTVGVRVTNKRGYMFSFTIIHI